jgi:GPH family glycoside/pentoside/hexuronide:cation symporter
MNHTRPIPSDGSLPPSQKWIWAIGGLTENFIGLGIIFLGMNIYNLGLGISATLVGVVLAVPRLIDVIIDPLIGNISDNTRTRWGRRRPFILVGGVIAATFFVLQWSPPTGWGHQAIFFYFLATTVLCFFGYAIFMIPFNALGLEMANDYNERTRIQSAKYLFLITAQMLCSWLYAGCFFFGDMAGPQEGVKTEVVGVRYVAWIVAALVILSSAVPAIFCRERDRAGEDHEKIHFLSALKLTLSLRPFLLLCAVFLSTNVGITLIVGVSTYVSIFHACGGDKQFGSQIGAIGGTLFGVLGFLAAWPVNWLARWQGKRVAMMCGLGVGILGALSTWIFYTPSAPWLQLIPWAIMCCGLACLWILTPSMLADVCDLDELKSGIKRAGMFSAVFAMILKGSIGVAAAASGILVDLVGFRPELAVQEPGTILGMRLMFALIPATLMGLSIVLVWHFPLTEEKVREVQARMKEKRQSCR